MKKLVFATMMCIASMSTNAQVLTSETVNNAYEEVSNKPNGMFFYNAEKSGNNITTMFIYKQISNNGVETLKPHMKYEYTYAADGTLTSKVGYHWDEILYEWECSDRYDYALVDGEYRTEYSRYNNTTHSFDEPTEKMVYSLMPGDSVNNVSRYHRDSSSNSYQLDSEIKIIEHPVLFAMK